jgi:hypothetical protein
MRSTNTRVEVFHSFEEENTAEHRRLAAMSPEERCHEMAILQERVWGSEWTSKPIQRVVQYEDLGW